MTKIAEIEEYLEKARAMTDIAYCFKKNQPCWSCSEMKLFYKGNEMICPYQLLRNTEKFMTEYINILKEREENDENNKEFDQRSQ